MIAGPAKAVNPPTSVNIFLIGSGSFEAKSITLSITPIRAV